MQTLGNATLDQLPDGVGRPTYDRAKITPGIVHIGLGNFHRAHQAWYLHRLMQQGLALDWGIVGAGVQQYDAAMREKLIAQDCLTTLIELDPAGISAEVTGAMIDYLPVEPGNGPLIAQMADPAIRIVSLTVTEGGYYLNAGTGAFDTDHPDIRHDAENPGSPRTAFGAIIAALRLRRDNGTGPFTLLCCDNLQGNGDDVAAHRDVAGPAVGCGAGGLDRGVVQLSQLDGRLHRARDRPQGACFGPGAGHRRRRPGHA